MAEQSVDQITEELRRNAVRAIAQGGQLAQTATRNTSTGIANAAKSVQAGQDKDAGRYDVAGLAQELDGIVNQAVQAGSAWGARTAAFERGATGSLTNQAGNFFSGARSATPIVRSEAEAVRSEAEAALMRQLLDRELSVGQQGFSLSQALEQREAARRAQAFQEQQAAQSMALAREQMAFQQSQAAQAAQMDALQRQLIEEELAALQAAATPVPAPVVRRSNGMGGWGWGGRR